MMKKWMALALGLALGVCMTGCDAGKDSGGPEDPQPPILGPYEPETPENPSKDPSLEQLLEYDKYNLKTYLTPFWDGTVVYNETLWFAGEDDFYAPLMYEPDAILSVKSYDLTKTYEEGVDYYWEKGSKEITLPEDSVIPHMNYDEYYMVKGQFACTTERGRYLYYSEGPTISSQQVAVTYRHSDTAEWTMPLNETEKFSKTFEKLEKGEELKVVFYGDSITVGANSSGYWEVNLAPHAESYPEMVRSYMKARYPKATVSYANTAVGGTDSNWGADGKMNHDLDKLDGGAHFKTRVLDEHPDLLFIAFGMNDGPSVSDYKAHIRSMIERAREQDPDVEIMLVSGMTANAESGFYNKDYEAFQSALIDLSGEFEGVGVSTVLNTVRSLEGQTLGKRFRDWTGNNINHPNDFMARVYAQTILCTLFGEDYIEHI